MLRQVVTRGERHLRGCLNGVEAELLRTATAPPPVRARARNRRGGAPILAGLRGSGKMRRIAPTALVAATIAPADSATVHRSAVVRVERWGSDGGSEFFGYWRSVFGNIRGPREFEYDGALYIVRLFYITNESAPCWSGSRSGAAPGTRVFRPTTFMVDRVRFDLSDVTRIAGEDVVAWDDSGLDWRNGQLVSVELVEGATPVPTLPLAGAVLLGLLLGIGIWVRRGWSGTVGSGVPSPSTARRLRTAMMASVPALAVVPVAFAAPDATVVQQETAATAAARAPAAVEASLGLDRPARRLVSSAPRQTAAPVFIGGNTGATPDFFYYNLGSPGPVRIDRLGTEKYISRPWYNPQNNEAGGESDAPRQHLDRLWTPPDTPWGVVAFRLTRALSYMDLRLAAGVTAMSTAHL